MNETLFSGNQDIASLGSLPNDLLSNTPHLRSIRDLSDKRYTPQSLADD